MIKQVDRQEYGEIYAAVITTDMVSLTEVIWMNNNLDLLL
jgi:hypothetical protein